MSYDMNRPLKLADRLIDDIAKETDNAADFLAGINLAVRWLQGYSDFVAMSASPTLRAIKTRDED